MLEVSTFGSQLVQFALIWYLTIATGSAMVLATASLVVSVYHSVFDEVLDALLTAVQCPAGDACLYPIPGFTEPLGTAVPDLVQPGHCSGQPPQLASRWNVTGDEPPKFTNGYTA